MPNTVKETIQEILDLQPKWNANLTPEMNERGILVRNTLPQLLEKLVKEWPASIPDIGFQGRDGTGRKNRVPWVRIYSQKHSPKATDGWDVAFLFASDGSAAYLSLGMGSTQGKAFQPKNPEEVAEKIRWARDIHKKRKTNIEGLLEPIQLKDPGHLGQSYENSNVYNIKYRRDAVPDDEQIIKDITRFLGMLGDLYQADESLDSTSVQQAPETPQRDRQIWVFAPGPQARYWNDCRSGSIAVFGAELLGPLDVFESKDDIQQRLKVIYAKDTEPSNDARAAWEFSHVMKEGDIVIAKKGNRKIVGFGIVRGYYRHDPSRIEYPNLRDVEWTHVGEWLLPDGERFALKTLTNITRYRDFVDKILGVIGIGFQELPVATGTRHYWLNCAPDVWRVSEYPVGTEEIFTTHNDKGNKRQVYACFLAAKPGDLVIGYETTPVQKVTSLLEITQGVHEEDEGECIRLKIVEQLEQTRSLKELRVIPQLVDCDPVKGERRGSLFQLTKTEYDAILGETLVEDDDVPEPDLAKEVYTIEDALDGLFVEKDTFCDWLKQWKAEKNLILQGAPGVGKTFVARRLAYALMQKEDKERVALVQFHQSYGYEDFVQGIKPVRVKEGELTRTVFDLRNGVFYEFCQRAKRDPSPHVFIIDEINRGNLSRILGELLMLIESDKRGEEHALRLAYQEEGQSFFVPDNVYILGMMNTADRSLAVVDYALRRRFRFATLVPAFEGTTFREYLTEVCDEELADRIILRLRRLNEDIAKDTSNLGPGFCLGHSYFCRVQNAEDYREVISFQVAPLLREYWFDQPRKAEERILELLSL